jgi:hypothetical protein
MLSAVIVLRINCLGFGRNWPGCTYSYLSLAQMSRLNRVLTGKLKKRKRWVGKALKKRRRGV